MWRIVSILALAAIAIIALILLPKWALAAEIQADTLMICDTYAQASRLTELWFDGKNDKASAGARKEAVRAVNVEAGEEQACGVGDIEFLSAGELQTIRTDGGTFQVFRILLIGVIFDDGAHAAQPAFLYAVTRVDERPI